MTPDEQHKFLLAALLEANHPEVAAIAYELEGDFLSTGFQWERLGRCPSLQEVTAVVRASRLLADPPGCYPPYYVGLDEAEYAKLWHFGLKHLRDLGPCHDEAAE